MAGMIAWVKIKTIISLWNIM